MPPKPPTATRREVSEVCRCRCRPRRPQVGFSSARLGENPSHRGGIAATLARFDWPRLADRAFAEAAAGSTETVRGGGRSADSYLCEAGEELLSPRSGARAALKPKRQPQPMRANVMLAVRTPHASANRVHHVAAGPHEGSRCGAARSRRLNPARSTGRLRSAPRSARGALCEQSESSPDKRIAERWRSARALRICGVLRARDRLPALSLTDCRRGRSRCAGLRGGRKRQRNGHSWDFGWPRKKSNEIGRRNPPFRRDAVEGLAL